MSSLGFFKEPRCDSSDWQRLFDTQVIDLKKTEKLEEKNETVPPTRVNSPTVCVMLLCECRIAVAIMDGSQTAAR